MGAGQAVALLAFTFAVLAIAPASALATTDTIYAAPSPTGLADCTSAANACTLAMALGAASAASGEDVTIDLAASGATPYPGFSIESGSESSLTLIGAGETVTDISGGGTPAGAPLVEVDDAGLSVELENMEISGGDNTASYGGNMGLDGGTVTLSNVWVYDGRDNSGAGYGGGIEVGGGTVTIEDSQITGNSVATGGGGIMSFGGTLTLEDSTVSGNQAGDGSAIYAEGTVNVLDSTIASNTGAGDVIDTEAGGTGNIYGSTIAGNGYGIDNGNGTLTIGASVLADNGPGHDCDSGSEAFVDEGYNYADDASCDSGSHFFTQSTSHYSASVNLGTLGANGGPTEAIPITGTSQAYDVVAVAATLPGDPESGAFCSGNDQRGIARTQGPASACSAGAFQYAPPVVTSVSPRSALELGLPITLSGYSLGNVTSATFGAAAATITSQSAGSISLAVPVSLALGSQPITLTNTDGSATVPFSAVASPSIGTSILTPGELKVPYAESIPVAGGAGPFTYALESGALPAGLSLSSAGVVSGTPTKAGGSAFSVQVTDANAISSSIVDVSLVIATPVVSLLSTRVKVVSGEIAVVVDCASAPCIGHVSLTESVEVKAPNHHTKLESVALASAPYSLTAGQSGTVELTLTSTGDHVLSRHALRKARKHPLSETLTAAAAGATTATESVKVR